MHSVVHCDGRVAAEGQKLCEVLCPEALGEDSINVRVLSGLDVGAMPASRVDRTYRPSREK